MSIDDRKFATNFSGLKSTAITAGSFLLVSLVVEEYLKRLRRFPEEDVRRKKASRIAASAADDQKHLLNKEQSTSTLPCSFTQNAAGQALSSSSGVAAVSSIASPQSCGNEPPSSRGMEDWAMGYLFRARTYVPYRPTPDYSTWPLAWIWESAWRLDQKFFQVHCGGDASSYVRFLRACFYWTTLQLFTVFPVLLAINFVYSDVTISTVSIERCSLSALTTTAKGRSLLWVHTVSIWFICFTWFITLLWLGHGIVEGRRDDLRQILNHDAEERDGSVMMQKGKKKDIEEKADSQHRHEITTSNNQDEYVNGDEGGRRGGGDAPRGGTSREPDVGWRYRTVFVLNIPEEMRTEERLREYFLSGLRDNTNAPPSRNSSSATQNVSEEALPQTSAKTFAPLKTLALKRSQAVTPTLKGISNDPSSSEDSLPLISNIIIVRKQAELNELYNKYRSEQALLESAHVALAENVVNWVAKKIQAEEAAGGHPVVVPKVQPKFFRRLFHRRKVVIDEEEEKFVREDDAILVQSLRAYAVDKSVAVPYEGGKDNRQHLWSVLHSLESRLLDPFQPLKKLKHFRGQCVPAIDYHLAKLNLLHALIEEKRANITNYEPASSAFVTFTRASDARRARLELTKRPTDQLINRKYMDCKVMMAPEVRDLDWNRLVYVSLSSDIVRGIILQVFIWLATIFWVVPVSFVVGLLSLDSLERYAPGIADYLRRNAVTYSIFSNLLPTGLVAILGMLVPTLIGMLTRNGQAFATITKMHSAVQARYWKWMIVNIVIVFCIGLVAFTAFLNAFKQPGSVLSVIATAFPKGATFFVSWSILVVGVHNGIEHALFGIPYINHGSIRKLRAPRKREEQAQPRSFSYFYWVPNHSLVIAITEIFAILNPLVIPFNFIYFSVALVVFKNQFAHVFWRRWYENGGRLVFRRVFRYSLDTLVVAQVVAMVLMFVTKRYDCGGAIIPLIPFTVVLKIIGTRWFDKLMDEIDEAEIDLVCDHNDVSKLSLSTPLADENDAQRCARLSDFLVSVKIFTTITLPSLVFHPRDRLPSLVHPSQQCKTYGQSFDNGAIGIEMSHPYPLANEGAMKIEVNEKKFAKPLRVPHARIQQVYVRSSTANISGPMQVMGSVNEDGTQSVDFIDGDLLSLHPHIIRDDRPVTHLHYDNPAVVVPLSRSLWLPRNPLRPIDLADTVDYHGTALVSSEGGRGVIGSWEDQLIDTEIKEVEDGVTDHVQGPDAKREKRLSTPISQQIVNSALPYDGTERILVAGEVAAKIEAEEGLPASANSRRRASDGTAGSSIRRFMSGTYSINPPPMPRRGTGASAASKTSAHSHPSPVISAAESGIALQKISPTIDVGKGRRSPSFSALPSPELKVVDHAFPATSPERGRKLSSPESARALAFSPSETGPSPSRLAPSPTHSRAGTTRRTRAGRSGSHVPSTSEMILEASTEEEGQAEVTTVSQLTALRTELLQEAKVELEKQHQKEQSRQRIEAKDKKASRWKRLILGGAKEEEV